jgi:hypothetical protein
MSTPPADEEFYTHDFSSQSRILQREKYLLHLKQFGV